MFESLFMGTIIWCMPMSELEVFVTNVELWKTRDGFKFIKIMNIN